MSKRLQDVEEATWVMCDTCGKRFVIPIAGSWAYKITEYRGGSRYKEHKFHTWSCMRQYMREKNMINDNGTRKAKLSNGREADWYNRIVNVLDELKKGKGIQQAVTDADGLPRTYRMEISRFMTKAHQHYKGDLTALDAAYLEYRESVVGGFSGEAYKR